MGVESQRMALKPGRGSSAREARGALWSQVCRKSALGLNKRYGLQGPAHRWTESGPLRRLSPLKRRAGHHALSGLERHIRPHHHSLNPPQPTPPQPPPSSLAAAPWGGARQRGPGSSQGENKVATFVLAPSRLLVKSSLSALGQ